MVFGGQWNRKRRRAAALQRRKIGRGVVVEPDDFVPFVLGEAVLVQEIEGVVPLAVDAEVQHLETEILGNFSEVVFWVRGHA